MDLSVIIDRNLTYDGAFILQNGCLWINDHRRIVNAFVILDLDYCNSILYGFKKLS